MKAHVTVSYDANGQLTSLSSSTHDGNGAPVALGTLTLRYDNSGRLTYRNDSATAVASYYRYDAAGQLIAANSTAASPAPNQSYSYDSNGNRVAASTPSRSMGEGAVAAETTSSYLTGANNTLLSDGVYRYSYDAAGNRIGQTLLDASAATATTVVTTLFSYDNHNRLVEVVQQNGSHQALASVRYTYDLFDRLIGRDQRDYVTQAGDVSRTDVGTEVDPKNWTGE